jgi:hypothetical protein
MIDGNELAICKRRGHDPGPVNLHQGWVNCKWCGIWLREVRTMEEREDTPPESEQNDTPRFLRAVRGDAGPK